MREEKNPDPQNLWDWTQNCTLTVKEVLSKYKGVYKFSIPCGPKDYLKETADIPFQSSKNIYKT